MLFLKIGVKFICSFDRGIYSDIQIDIIPKSLVEEMILSTMSLMYKRNIRGPRMEPWGTSA